MGMVDPQIQEGEVNLADLQHGLSLIERLNPDLHQKFILAALLYQQALQLIEAKPDLAYLNLVSAIEAVAAEYPVNKTLSDYNPQLAKLLLKIDDVDLRGKIESQILKEKFIGQRFVAFITDHVDDSFWEISRPEFGKVDKIDLPATLKQIYNQRSKFLHEGAPFPPTVYMSPLYGSEKDFSLGIETKGKVWLPEEQIPYPHFFERLVNHVLLNYLNRNLVGPMERFKKE